MLKSVLKWAFCLSVFFVGEFLNAEEATIVVGEKLWLPQREFTSAGMLQAALTKAPEHTAIKGR